MWTPAHKKEEDIGVVRRGDGNVLEKADHLGNKKAVELAK